MTIMIDQGQSRSMQMIHTTGLDLGKVFLKMSLIDQDLDRVSQMKDMIINVQLTLTTDMISQEM